MDRGLEEVRKVKNQTVLKVKIAPSIIAANWVDIYSDVERAKRGDFIHVDIMDGHFVPNLTLGPDIAKAIHKLSNKPLDIHLMLERPDKYIERFVFEGVFRITFHYESYAILTQTINTIKDFGLKVGIAISPDTPVNRIIKVLPEIDQVLVMTVYPGFSGQKLLEWVISKIYELDDLRKKYGLEFTITADGGINYTNLEKLGPVDEVIMGAGFFTPPQRVI